MSMEQASEQGAFRDALCLRFGWTPTRIASHCPCGHPFSVSHAFSCSKGAMPTLRHNAIRDITAQLFTEVCPNVGVEPQLQPLSGETFQYRTVNTDECSHLDIQTKNFWDNSNHTISLMLGYSMLLLHPTVFPPALVTENSQEESTSFIKDKTLSKLC